MARWKIAGIDFDHMHMGDNLRMIFDHPDADIVGICDENPERMTQATKDFGLSGDQVFTDYRELMDKTKPDIVVLCPATARHGEWTGKVATYGVHIIVEKPFAASLKEADAMAAAVSGNQRLSINWPLTWMAGHRTAYRLIGEGLIGDVLEVHTYGGNRGPLWHLADKVETTAEWVQANKAKSWFYKKAEGGGSLLDYAGYGTTLGSWYQGGRKPIEVTCVMDEPEGLEVDEHSVTVARYAHGVSKFETRWGTFTDPWVHQPQPKCGFVVKGTGGTISIYDYEPKLRVQTNDCPEGKDVPVDPVESPFQNPIQHMIHCLENDLEIDGPSSVAISRIGQQIVDTAYKSAKEKRTLPLLEA